MGLKEMHRAFNGIVSSGIVLTLLSTVSAATTRLPEGLGKVLEKLGKLAVYVPPVMTGLLITEKQAAASLGGPPAPP